MKKTIVRLFSCLLVTFFLGAFAKADKNSLDLQSGTEDLKTLQSRLDNIESYASNLEYIMGHLDKHVVMLQIVPLSKPHTSFNEVILYASNALTEALNLNTHNFQYVLSNVSKYFSEAAFSQLNEFLIQENILQDAKLKVQENHAVLVGHPYISKAYTDHRAFHSERLRDLYTWEVEVPIFIETISDKGTVIRQKNIKLNVLRTSIEFSPDQMLIDKITIQDDITGI